MYEILVPSYTVTVLSIHRTLECQMPHNPPGVKTRSNSHFWLTVSWYSEIIKAYQGSAWSLYSLISLPLLHYSQGPPAMELQLTVSEKSSYIALPRHSKVRVQGNDQDTARQVQLTTKWKVCRLISVTVH